MWNENDMNVSSGEVIAFKDKLVKLSQVLKECHDTISNGLAMLGQDWRDVKYEQFVEEFKSSKEEILEIGERYEQWSAGYLAQKIQDIIDYENS